MIYNIIYIVFEESKCKSKWLENVKHIVSSNGYANVWQSQCCLNKKWFQSSFKQKVKDQYLQHWNSLLNSSSGAITYRLCKNEFGMNTYFYILNNTLCRILPAFRTRNHRLPIELGRWSNIPISERKCHLCQKLKSFKNPCICTDRCGFNLVGHSEDCLSLDEAKMLIVGKKERKKEKKNGIIIPFEKRPKTQTL